jgi:hypothetical protein
MQESTLEFGQGPSNEDQVAEKSFHLFSSSLAISLYTRKLILPHGVGKTAGICPSRGKASEYGPVMARNRTMPKQEILLLRPQKH